MSSSVGPTSTHLHSDHSAREAIKYLRGPKVNLSSWSDELRGHTQVLIGYVAERLPKNMKKMRSVSWTLPGDGLGNVSYFAEKGVGFEINKLIDLGATGIQVGPVAEVPDDS